MTDNAAMVKTPYSSPQAADGVRVSVEALLYLALGVLALALRLAEVDVIPLGAGEAREALAAWRTVNPAAPGAVPLSDSPLLFALNTVAVGLLGASDLTARLMTVLGGVGVTLLPLLFRQELGRVNALLASAMLTFSTASLLAARTMRPVIWAVLLVGVGVWLLKRFVETRQSGYAAAATASGVGVVLLAEPAGYVLALQLLIAWWVLGRLSVDDAPESQPGGELRAALAEWPWRDALIASGAVVFLVSTLFFLVPGGLAHVGQLLESGLNGILVRPAGQPFVFPLLVTLLYEPLVWLFGAVGVYFALRDPRPVTRFMVGWVFAGLLASLAYAGAGPEHALWLVIPLAVLAADALARALRPAEDAYWVVPGWAVPALAAGVVALLFITGVNFLKVAQGLMTMTPEGGAINMLHLLLAAMSLLLLVILFFLGGSLWGPQAAWHGLALGVALFLGVYGASSAWQAAVVYVDNPRELWHVAPVSRHLGLLRESVQEASLRFTGAPDRLPVLAMIPEDGAAAWQLRDFAALRFVDNIDRRTDEAALITPLSFQPELLGARYVGQDFIVTRAWNVASLRAADLPIYVMQRRALSDAQTGVRIVFWLRGDVYGLPPESDAAAVPVQ